MSHDCVRGYCPLQITSSGSRICLTKDHVIESGVCIYFSPQVPYTKVFHDNINGNHETHSSMEAPSLRMMLWSLLSFCSLYMIVKAFHFCVADQLLRLVRPHALSQDCIWIRVHTVRHGLMTCPYHYPGERFFYHSGLRWTRTCSM